MYGQGAYLRVLKPRTSNGTNIIINSDRTVSYRECHLPLTAKKNLEDVNRKYPDHLKMIIEIVPGVAVQQQSESNEKLEAAIAEIQALKIALAEANNKNKGIDNHDPSNIPQQKPESKPIAPGVVKK